MYTATITSKLLAKDKLTITVRFDGNRDSFSDTFQTNQPQADGWIEEQVKRKLKALNALPFLSEKIQTGKVIIADTEDPVTILTNDKEQYKAALVQFEKFVSALSKGFTTKENEDFIALKQKLTDNFRTEYLDLF